MIGDLLRRLTAPPSSDILPDEDAHLALAALMVRVARTDGNYTPEERDRIAKVLRETYSLDDAAANALRAEAEDLEAQAPDTVRFTRLIKDAVPFEERSNIVEALWKVAAVDGINADEHGLLRLVTNLVGVSDQQSALARQRALKQDQSEG